MSESDSPWLVVGLGNPGPTYAATRHNVGYMVGDLLTERMGASWRAHKSGRADVVEGRLPPGIDGPRVVLARSRSYMNESGGPVSTLASFYKIEPARIIAIYDELDLPFGILRVKFDGGDNGHNGLKSMRQSLGTGDFYRIRVGIGRPPGRQSPADFVLKPFSPTERRDLGVELEAASDAVETVMVDGLAVAQNRFN